MALLVCREVGRADKTIVEGPAFAIVLTVKQQHWQHNKWALLQRQLSTCRPIGTLKPRQSSILCHSLLHAATPTWLKSFQAVVHPGKTLKTKTSPQSIPLTECTCYMAQCHCNVSKRKTQCTHMLGPWALAVAALSGASGTPHN